MTHRVKKSLELNKFSKENLSPNFSYYKAKKNLGQNFLKSEVALNTMCSAGEVSDNDIILEIGPGKGALTKKLLEKAGKVVAVEKDRDLIKFLGEKFATEIENGKFILLNEDILDFDLEKNGFKKSKYKIISNIPYNITGAILKKFLSDKIQPSRIVLVVQKEIEERIVASDGKESILSLSVKAYGNPKYIMKVHKRFFSPAPKVDSAVLLISNISKDNFKTSKEEEDFFNLIKAGFAHKRKVLRRNLEVLQKNTNQIDNIFGKLKIDKKVRAEDINFEKWILISRNLFT